MFSEVEYTMTHERNGDIFCLETLCKIILESESIISRNIGCLASGVAQHAMREAVPHAGGVSKARQL
jgi:hypothetical protein